jgi:hypothetical protein
MNLRSIQEMEEESIEEEKAEKKEAKEVKDSTRKTHAMLYKSHIKDERSLRRL